MDTMVSLCCECHSGGCLRRDCVEKLKDLTQNHSSEGRRRAGSRVTSAGGTVHCNGRRGLGTSSRHQQGAGTN